MAKGRFLSKSVSTSNKLASLKSDSPRLLWTWLLPHLDCEGRFHADPAIVKGHAVTRLKNHTEKTVEADLQELAGVGLIIIYQVNGDRYLQFTQFDENQPGMRKDREAESQCPAPPEEVRIKSGVGPELVGEESKQALILKLKLELKLKEELQAKEFDAFWEQYPRKEAKKDAIAAYRAVIKNTPPEEILAALNVYKTKIDQEGTIEKFIKLPATFLRSDRWRDYAPKPKLTPEEFRTQQAAELERLQEKG